MYLVLNLRELENRNEIQSSIKAGKTDLMMELKVPIALTEHTNTEFIQTDEDEISYQGKMYDVISSRRGEDGFVYYSCINDTKEENLIEVQDVLRADNSLSCSSKQLNGKNNRQNLKDLITDYLPQANKTIVGICSKSIDFTSNLTFTGQACYAKVPSPPPQSI